MMWHHLQKTILTAALLMLLSEAAVAQGFRIHTLVFDELNPAGNRDAQKTQRPRIVARSLSLFHAGKAYDYLHAIGEVIVFEPVHRRFIILNTKSEMATTVDFDQIKHLLKLARQTSQEHVAELKQEKAAAPLRFQLNPRFKEHYDEQRQRLTLSSPYVHYEVQCAEAKRPEAVDAYLRYADWMCRLNYVLHPQLLLPEPRLALNATLRRKQLIPTEVELQAHIETRVHLRAEHNIVWKLDATDRSQIHHWETLLKSKNTRHVPFREYQRAQLISQSNKRR
jgi:hypothetical protein